MQDLSSDIRTQRWGEVQETIFAPYLVIPVFLQAIGIKKTKFKVTNKAATQTKKDLLYVLPHLVLWVLTIIGLIKFNYGKFGSEIFYGSVISFWLLNHLFNLTFAVLFFLGRPIYRKTERFLAEIPLKVSFEENEYDLETKNISENGLSFAAPYPYYFPQNEWLDLRISKGKHTAQLKGKVVRVLSNTNQWIYGVALEEMSEQVYLDYLQIIYDGFNRSLPQYYDPWVTPFDRFFDNIRNRMRGLKHENRPASKFAEMEVNEPVPLTGLSGDILSFNYETMTISTTERTSLIQPLIFVVDGVKFHLQFAEQNKEGHCIYTVQNISELVKQDELDKLINKWVQKAGEEIVDNDFAY